MASSRADATRADGGAPGDEAVAAAAPVAAPPLAPATRATGGGRSSRRGRRAPPALVAVAVVVGALFAAPLGYLVVRNATLGADLGAALASPRTAGPLLRTLALAASVAASAAAVGTVLAWLTTRTDLPLRRLWQVLAPLPLVIPSFVGAAALLAAFAPGGLLDEALTPLGVERLPTVEGFPAAFAVLTLLTYPYVLLPVAARLAALPPSPEESARLLGRRPWQVFWTVVLPQARGAVAAGALLVFLYAVSDFGAVQLVRYDTLTRAIYASRLLDPPQSLALGLVLGTLAVAVVAAERLLVRRPAPEALRVRRPLQVPLGRWAPLALGFVVAVLGAALAAPVAVLAWWAGRGVASGTLRSLPAGLADLAVPAANTALVGVVTAVVAVALVLPVAELVVRHRSRTGAAANALVVGGFALPGLVVALALGYWALQLPAGLGLYQSLPLLVFAYVVHFGAQAMRAAQVAVAGVPPRLEDAARVLGAGRRRRFLTVEAPLMLPGLLAGGGLVLLSAMKELPATLLLAPIGFDTVALEIWHATTDGFLAEAGLASLVLVALSGVLTWALVVRRAERLG